MALVGRSLDVSRVYVFQYQEGQRLLDNTHEWCASGVSAEIDELQGLPYDDLVPSFTPLLISQGIIAPRNITELPEDIRAILAPQGIQTVMIVPIYLHDRLHGFVGMDENRRSRRWLPEEISLLRLVANSLARTLERRETRRELMEAHDAAIQSVRLKSEFMAKMSHELRTPMTGVLGMLELLLETRLDDDQRVFAQDAYHSARTLLVLLDDVLDFSKIEAGRLDLVSEPVDIRAVIDEVRVALLPRLKNRPINFEVSIAPEIPGQLMGDATRLRQVLMNLAGNAVKFTDKGDVLVAVHLLELLQDYARLQFVVQDTGIGIAPEYIDRIFDSFVQADSSITRKYGGSGLGLTISRPLVQLMGSDITVESVPDQGSTFSFVLTLPVLPAAESGDAAHLAGLRILVAGGKDTGRYVLAQQMRLWGADVAEQGDLADLGEALAHVRQASAPVDIVLLHVDRPSSGQAALVQTLRDAAGAKMPCLIAVLDDIPAASGLYGACLQRPVQFADLLSVFDDCLLNAAHGLTIGDAPPPETAAARLLLAEDNPVNRRVILRSLRGMALAIDVAETGQEALALHTARPYDLILMDIRMPEMDGVTATRHIRELPGDAGHVPIVALTASVLKDELQTYQSAGMDAILSKPFEGDSLRQVVARYINKI
jgi:signal transduction histidine kinase